MQKIRPEITARERPETPLTIGFTLILLVALTGCERTGDAPASVDGQPTDGGFQVTGYRETGTLEPGAALTLINIYGDIRVRNQPGPEFLVSAQIQKLGDETRDVEFVLNRTDDGLGVNVTPPEGFNGRVDATLLIPEKNPLHLTTESGLIQVRVGNNEINANSTSGKIAVRGLAPMQLATVDGAIDVTVHRLGSMDTDIRTADGSVTLQFPPESDLKLVAETGGAFRTALAPSVKRAIKQTGNRLEVSIGAGQSRFTVKSERGDISLKSYGYEAG